MNDRIRIRNIEPQEIIIEGTGTPSGITNVYVNGVDVTVGTKAYVIVPTKLSELTNDEGFITAAEETDPTVPSYVKEITIADINSWNDKQNLLVSGSNIKTINNNSLLGSGDLEITPEYTSGYGIDITNDTISNTITSYNDLTDLPTPITNVSQLVNDSGFITNQVDDLVNYIPSSLLEKILPQVSDSGTDLYLDNTVNYNLKFKLDPHEIEQHTTTGKQLLNPVGDTNTKNGVTLTNNGDGTFTANGTASANTSFDLTNLVSYPITLTANESYTQSLEIISGTMAGGIVPAFKNGGGTISYNYFSCNKNQLSDTKTPTEDMTAYTYTYYIGSGGSPDNCTFRIQLEKGSSPTSYEEYTGGTPSPNPDYPQNIHVNSGENTITIINKNIFNYDKFIEDNSSATISGNAENFVYSGNGITSKINSHFINNTQYKISGRWNTTYGNGRVRIIYTDGTTQTMFENYSSTYADGTINITSYSSKTIDYIEIITWSTGNFRFINYQIERGTTATYYVPYEEQVYPIDLTDIIDLVSINTTWGKYENFIYRNTLDSPFYDSDIELNSLQLGNRVYKYISNSTDNWQELGNGLFSVDISPNPSFGSLKRFTVSSHFLDKSLATDTDNESWIECIGFTIYIHFAPNLSISSLSDLTTWLENNTVTVYAIRGGLQDYNADPTDISYFYPELASQYNNLTEHSTAYEGGTSIYQENDDLPFELEASTFEIINN